MLPVRGSDHRDVRRNGDSTGGAARTHRRGIATRSARPPERDRFLETAGTLRDLVLHARTASWRLTLASACACASFQLPLRIDNALTRGLLFLASRRGVRRPHGEAVRSKDAPNSCRVTARAGPSSRSSPCCGHRLTRSRRVKQRVVNSRTVLRSVCILGVTPSWPRSAVSPAAAQRPR